MSRWSTTLIKGAAVTLCVYFLASILLTDRDAYSSTKQILNAGRHHLTEDTSYDHINNETLGFEKVYAIGLKERTDKRDFLSLAASLHGMKVKWMDGVHPDSIVEKAIPDKYNTSNSKPTVIACWRAHMNALRDVVENGYASALIMEDDADWDVSVRQQLREFARGVRTLTNTPKPPKDAPYGTDWDILWVGGCASGAADNETSIYAIPNDPTIPNSNHRVTWGGPPESWKQNHPELPENSTRYVYRAEMGCCLYGYAVSLEGAQRILAALSVDHLDCAVDNAMSDLCAGSMGRPHLRCYAPFPNLIGTFKPQGFASRDSDIETYDGNAYHAAQAWNLVYSTRLNIQRLVRGDDVVVSQWESEDWWSEKEVDMREFEYPGGFLVT
ncbi:hypothetical protein FE257_000371 [Aspergillus nanangensis]|uniref:LPS glycosyltransferase n=1 Tax=Aspergillus nanangensis TaxID=2582783 RepID=A0AAD4GXA4_ASPNN|nr:hypothetical protein FE257_000371 [Aspergillus nanangensis]